MFKPAQRVTLAVVVALVAIGAGMGGDDQRFGDGRSQGPCAS